jgi:hypothetical protein
MEDGDKTAVCVKKELLRRKDTKKRHEENEQYTIIFSEKQASKLYSIIFHSQSNRYTDSINFRRKIK